MKKKRKNSFDKLIENLTQEFAKIPNFNLTQTDSDANRVFNFVLSKFSEIHDYQSLYKLYFIPNVNKSIIDLKKELKGSVYNKTLKITEEQLKINYFDTIRLGYVGLFHKIENYVKELLIEANLIFCEDSKVTIENFYKNKYGFKFNDWYSDLTIHKINWICNCVKHYDGYPRKIPKYPYLEHLPEEKKINLSHDEFYMDLGYVVEQYYMSKLSQVFSLGAYKMLVEEFDVNDMNETLRVKYEALEDQVRILMYQKVE